VPQTAEFSTSWTIHSAHVWFANIAVSETNAYLGLPLILVLAAAVVAFRRKPFVQITAIVTLVMAVFSLGTDLRVASHTYDIWLPWRILHGLPLVSSLQANRLSMFVDLGVAAIVAFSLRQSIEFVSTARARAGAGTGAGGALAIVGILVALVPLMPTLHFVDYSPTIPLFFTTSDVDAIPQGATALLVPFPRGERGNDSGMVWQAESDLRFKIVGGAIYVPEPHGTGATFGGVPTELTYVLGVAQNDAQHTVQTPIVLSEERRNIAAWKVDDVAIGPMKNEGIAVKVIEQVLGMSPVTEGGVHLWTRVNLDPRIRKFASSA
jgi:hypothetical protein